MKTRTILLSSVTAVLATAGAAQAQNVGEAFARDRNIAVLERPHPEYRALGIRAGTFLLSPVLTTSAGYDSNVLAVPTGTSSALGRVAGMVNLRSTWPVNALAFQANLGHDAYQESSESRTTYGVNANGQFDASRDLAFVGAAGFRHLVEDRTASGAGFGNKPIRFDQISASAGGAQAFNRLRVTVGYQFDKFDFENGRLGTAVLPQDYRDHDQHQATLRGDYAISPATAVFLEGRYDKRVYDQAPAAAPKRDSDGYEVSAGTDFDLAALARGKVQVGYLSQTFDAPAIPKISGLGGRAEVMFFPNQLVTLTLRATRTVGDTGLVSAPALSATSVGGEVDYEYRRNIILTARLEYEDDQFKGIDRKDNRLSGSMGGTWLLNRGVGVNLLYSHFSQDSSGAVLGADYDVDRISGSLILRY